MINPKRVTLELARSFLGNHPRDPELQRVVDHIERRAPISKDVGEISEAEESFWDRLADSVARIGGSWPFIGAFFLFLLVWTGINSILLVKGNAFDPYPYIFLNLMLSMLAAIQAPIIMMSQNRQAEKDRVAAAHDYEVNLRSELEILGMQEKLDRLRGEQHVLILAKQDQILGQLSQIEKQLQTFAP
ncbi:DUF1003 domain-containing protein [Sphingobium xenophagum]|uniref:Cyclic nucleotide-binding protein n=1 Tax=Sphingobium xenophagum TaxID=121428 RepID=A0A401J356_SPHXE|nr:DUF1003 domain-containing protein [Sphingobium xenophagum]GBH31081.1 hypothetical protein MBESOW_P2342 [Sphingobium xenophagum]